MFHSLNIHVLSMKHYFIHRVTDSTENCTSTVNNLLYPTSLLSLLDILCYKQMTMRDTSKIYNI